MELLTPILFFMMIIGIPITVFEDFNGNQKNVVDGQQAILLSQALLIWIEVFK